MAEAEKCLTSKFEVESGGVRNGRRTARGGRESVSVDAQGLLILFVEVWQFFDEFW